jgi:membrane protein required for colicin V production
MNAIAQAFNWADYFIIAIIFISTVISLMRGFTSEALSLIIWIIAAVIAFKGAPSVGKFFSNIVQTASIRFLIGFVAIFIIILIMGAVINHLMGIFVLSTGLSGTNRLLGMVFGFGRGILLIAIFILFARSTSLVRDTWWQSSQLIPHFRETTNWLHQFLPEHLNHFSSFIHPNAEKA